MLSFIAVAAIFAHSLQAHPGHDVHHEALERRQFYQSLAPEKRSLAHCAPHLHSRGISENAQVRRTGHVVAKRDESPGE